MLFYTLFLTLYQQLLCCLINFDLTDITVFIKYLSFDIYLPSSFQNLNTPISPVCVASCMCV